MVITEYRVAITRVGIMNFRLSIRIIQLFYLSISSIITLNAENGWAPTIIVPLIVPFEVDLPTKNDGVPFTPALEASAMSLATSSLYLLESKQPWKVLTFKPKLFAMAGSSETAIPFPLEMVLVNMASWYLKYIESPPWSLAHVAAIACEVANGL